MKTYERPQVFCQEDLCEGCPGDNGSFCTLTKGYTTGDKDYRPTWERNGESPDKITWIKRPPRKDFFFSFLEGLLKLSKKDKYLFPFLYIVSYLKYATPDSKILRSCSP